MYYNKLLPKLAGGGSCRGSSSEIHTKENQDKHQQSIISVFKYKRKSTQSFVKKM